MNINIGDTLEVYPNVFGRVISEYSNGYETTAGFVNRMNAKVNNDVGSITYLSEYADCLPGSYFEIEWLDDRNKRLKIKEVNFGKLAAFIMEDGYASQHITSLMEETHGN